MTIFVPTTMINVIGFATFFYKWFDFQNRIMVSLTSLLVLSTLFSQVSSSLPKTSYLKLVDIWFLISMFYCFSIIINHVIIEYYHKYHNPFADVSKNEQLVLESDDDKKKKPSFHSYNSNAVSPSINEPNGNVKIRPGATPLNDVEGIVQKDPYEIPKRIDSLSYKITILTYVIIFVVFWLLAFKQMIEESYTEMKNNYDPIEGYP